LRTGGIHGAKGASRRIVDVSRNGRVQRRTVLVARLGWLRVLRLPKPQSRFYNMKKEHTKGSPESEPIGIVISRGARTEPAPAIFAFVWGAAPERKPVPKDTKAA
jgi:hypothetical protein